jgi:hypothetical protein
VRECQGMHSNPTIPIELSNLAGKAKLTACSTYGTVLNMSKCRVLIMWQTRFITSLFPAILR